MSTEDITPAGAAASPCPMLDGTLGNSLHHSRPPALGAAFLVSAVTTYGVALCTTL